MNRPAYHTSKGQQHLAPFREINPNGKVPVIVDTEGPGGKPVRVFDSSAILLYLAHETGRFLGAPEDQPELLSWLFFIASGLRPFSGQASSSHPKSRIMLATVIGGRQSVIIKSSKTIWPAGTFIVGNTYTIADMSLWGWIDRASRVLKGEVDPFAATGSAAKVWLVQLSWTGPANNIQVCIM